MAVNVKDFYNVEYEQITLGSMILYNECIDEVSTLVSSDDFYNLHYKKIFKELCNLYTKYGQASPAMICNACSDIPVTLISALTSNVVTSANVAFYANAVAKYSKKRKQREILAKQLEALDNGEDVDDNIASTDSAENKLMQTSNNESTVDMKSLVPSIVEMMQKNFEKTTPWLGYDTGWSNLNDVLDGLRDGKLIIIGARPSMGKSAFALQLAANLCKSNVNTTFFSFEMDYLELGTRLCSLESGVPIPMIEHGFAAKDMSMMGKLNNAFARIYEYPFSIIDTPLKTEKELFAKIRTQAKNGTKAFIIDHIGLLHHSDDSLKRYEQVGDITIRLHHLAKELGITIIILCQLKRDSEGKKPNLADLRESGDIEQNADVVMFIHRNRAQGGEISIPTEILVEKNRGGQTGIVKMNFLPNQTKFVEAVESKNPIPTTTEQPTSKTQQTIPQTFPQPEPSLNY
ncbi:MAG: hypothetical protein KBT03_03210 [Bacteroidales bacterium]|nr:hypothetical protein [Candidatus Scybalousia scybalohippi]